MLLERVYAIFITFIININAITCCIHQYVLNFAATLINMSGGGGMEQTENTIRRSKRKREATTTTTTTTTPTTAATTRRSSRQTKPTQQHNDLRSNQSNVHTTDSIEFLTDTQSYDQLSSDTKPITPSTNYHNNYVLPSIHPVKRKFPTFSTGSYTDASTVDIKDGNNTNKFMTQSNQPLKYQSPSDDDDVILIDSEHDENQILPVTNTKSTKSKSIKAVKQELVQPSGDYQSDPSPSTTNQSITTTKLITKGKKKKMYEFTRDDIIDALD